MSKYVFAAAEAAWAELEAAVEIDDAHEIDTADAIIAEATKGPDGKMRSELGWPLLYLIDDDDKAEERLRQIAGSGEDVTDAEIRAFTRGGLWVVLTLNKLGLLDNIEGVKNEGYVFGDGYARGVKQADELFAETLAFDEKIIDSKRVKVQGGVLLYEVVEDLAGVGPSSFVSSLNQLILISEEIEAGDNKPLMSDIRERSRGFYERYYDLIADLHSEPLSRIFQ